MLNIAVKNNEVFVLRHKRGLGTINDWSLEFGLSIFAAGEKSSCMRSEAKRKC